MKAADRHHRITFQRATPSRSSLGGKTAGAGDWADLGQRTAKILYGTGAERRAAAVEQGVQAATFQVLADSLTRTITSRDRIVHGSLAYDITGIAPIGRGPDEFHFTALASRG